MKLLSVFSIVMVLILTSCAKVDLVPLPKDGLTGSIAYCKRDGDNLVVHIKNNGTESAPASTTKVEFTGGTLEMPTPQIPANGTVEVRFLIPVGCHNPDCDFKITVDSKTEVPESNEGNNTVDGICIG
jgi:subtilase family serine protease